MQSLRKSLLAGAEPRARQALDWVWRVIPPAVLVFVGAYLSAQQALRPHHRVIKGLVMLALMGLMLRFDMVYSVYLFTMLFVFPSGISIGSSNSVLMTLIPMIWAVRATSRRLPLFKRTPIDAAVALFLISYLVSMFNVNNPAVLTNTITVLWRSFAACAFCYCIIRFVDDEEKLMRLGQVMCVSCALVMSTAVLELFFPGATLIPGWIGLTRELGEGEFKYRIEGLRVGGSFDSHGMLADFGTQMILFMAFYARRAVNPVPKLFWIVSAVTTFIAILATANRGAMAGLALGVIMFLVYFRDRIGLARTVMLAGLAVAGVVVSDSILSEKTIAVSVIGRFGQTEFEGMVPDTRTMTWKPALADALEKPFFGHGPFYDTGIGLTKRYWPHNGYLFFFCTLGLLGLGAFLFVVHRVWRESRLWRHPAVRGTQLGDFLALSQIWLFVMLLEQMRTDHQRDDIYPYIVWMCFGVITAAAALARERIVEAREAAVTQ